MLRLLLSLLIVFTAPALVGVGALATTRELGSAPACRAYRGLPAGDGLVLIKGGRFVMGSDAHYFEEGKSRAVFVPTFLIDAHAVTNAQFERFTAATGYRTLAERGLPPEVSERLGSKLSVPGSLVFVMPRHIVMGEINWWQFRPGANWRHPEAASSHWVGRNSHPVVHIAREDALAYARWLGRDLPTEAEFEYAARGGGNTEFAWGTELYPNGKAMANIWQGEFPVRNSGGDGYLGTAPVGCFPANGYGLYDMIGNVWQWTRDPWFPRHPDESASHPEIDLEDALLRHAQTGQFGVIKGGSFLCSPFYCKRYRPSARHAQELIGSTNHIGFRTVQRVSANGR